MTLPEERELLQRIHTDRREFGVLFDHYYRVILGYLYRRTGSYELAKDMAAETFLKAFLKIETFVWRDISISSWLYRIATNEANQYFRKRKYAPVITDRLLNAELVRNVAADDQIEVLEHELSLHEDFKLIQEKLKSLEIHYQEVIALRYFENKDNREIASILDKPEGTVKSLLSRGLEKLRGLVLTK